MLMLKESNTKTLKNAGCRTVNVFRITKDESLRHPEHKGTRGPEGWTAKYHMRFGPLKMDIKTYEYPIK